MDTFEFTEHSHQRYNPLTDSWVLCSPHRAKRPWQGKWYWSRATRAGSKSRYSRTPSGLFPLVEHLIIVLETRELTDLWTQTTRIPLFSKMISRQYKVTSQYLNPAFYSILVIFIDSAKSQNDKSLMDKLFKVQSVRGTARVVCFTPKHNVSMAQMKKEEIVPIIHAWRDQVIDLEKQEHVNYVQIFENKGAAMGCSNPHPHGQVHDLM